MEYLNENAVIKVDLKTDNENVIKELNDSVAYIYDVYPLGGILAFMSYLLHNDH